MYIGTRNPLLIPNLFECILDSLVESKGSELEDHSSYRSLRSPPSQIPRRTRRTLVALAQTCHALSDPCLDRL